MKNPAIPINVNHLKQEKSAVSMCCSFKCFQFGCLKILT